MIHRLLPCPDLYRQQCQNTHACMPRCIAQPTTCRPTRSMAPATVLEGKGAKISTFRWDVSTCWHSAIRRRHRMLPKCISQHYHQNWNRWQELTMMYVCPALVASVQVGRQHCFTPCTLYPDIPLVPHMQDPCTFSLNWLHENHVFRIQQFQ